MRTYENECCDCAAPGYPCRGSLCPRLEVLHVSCDECGGEYEEMYCYEGKEYCLEHLLEELVGNGIIEQVDFDE